MAIAAPRWEKIVLDADAKRRQFDDLCRSHAQSGQTWHGSDFVTVDVCAESAVS